MVITYEGTNNNQHTLWKLHVPPEHCIKGLEVGILATENGLAIGGEVLSWDTLELAKAAALD